MPLALLFLAFTTAAALPEKAEKALLEELSGERAKDHVVEITRFERIQASEGWHAAAEYVKARLERFGYADARIEGYPSNGETLYYTWTTPVGWKAEGATLLMTAPERLKLADYEEVPNTLIKHSGPAEVEAELVDVGAGTAEADYLGKDVRGKIVLAHGASPAVRAEAMEKRGALGIVSYFPPEVRAEHPDLVRYTAFWTRWSERDRVGFGFNVSKRHGLLLRNLLAKGEKVVLKASVRSRFYESRIETLTATLPGSTHPEEEIVIGGHLDHPSPSANDNASGAAGVLEMARTLKALVDSGRIEPPKRTIRFMWFSEFFGTIAYLKHHPEIRQRALAAINCDMIGEDLEATDSLFNLTLTPHSTRSYLNDLVEGFMHRAARLEIRSLRGNPAPMNYRIVPYGGGSDHAFFTDSSVGIPSVQLGHWPDPFHHTSQDTPDKTDPTELKRAMYVALGSALVLAGAEDADAERLAEEVAARGLGRIGTDMGRALALLDGATSAEALHRARREAGHVTDFAYEREAASVAACARLARSAGPKGYVRSLGEGLLRHRPMTVAELDAAYLRRATALGARPSLPGPSAAEQEADRIVPRRTETFTAPLRAEYLSEKLGEPDVHRRLGVPDSVGYEVANFMDGRRSLLAIRNAVSAEHGPVDLEKVKAYVELLARAGLVELSAKK